MINKVAISNIMSWKGYTEIEYKDGIIMFDGKYGAGKSSLLVDSLDIVFSNKARENPSQIITKGEESGFIEVYITIDEIQYKIYWFHQPKAEIEQTGKNGELKIKKISAKTEWKTYYKQNNEWIESQKTPEDILGMPYEIAKKTFIIGQHELAKFSEALPSEKYEVIADAFGISTLFKIGEKASEKIKDKNLEKSLLMNNLDGVDTTQFDKIEEKTEIVQEIKKELEVVKNENEVIQKEKENLLQIKNEIINLENYKNQNNLIYSQIETIKNQKIEDFENEILKLEQELQKQDISIIEKEEEKLNTFQNEKIQKEHLLNSQMETFKATGLNSLENKKNEVLLISKQFQEIIIENYQRYTTEFKNEISKYNVENLKLENAQNQILLENNLKENSSIEIQKNVLINENNKNLEILKKIKEISNSTCPTCSRPISNDDYVEIEKNLLLINKTKSKEISKKEEKIEKIKIENLQISEKITNNTIKIQEFELLSLLKKKEELGEKGKKIQEDYKNEKIKFENDYNEKVNENYNIIKKLADNISIFQDNIQKLKEKNQYYEIKEKLEKIKQKTFLFSGANYSLSDLKFKLSNLEAIKFENEKRIEELIEKNKDYTSLELLNLKIEELNLKYYKNNQLKEEKNEIYLNLSNELNKLNSLKIEYDKIKINLEKINKKIENLEKIAFIFGKKGEPKNIIENIILPQLELKTNNILTQMTNGNYNVEFSLSSITGDGKETKKNVFDIIVYQNGIPQTYKLLSGGERTNVNFAIRLGITECLNDLLGKKVNDFLILDETFNAVDANEGGEELIKGLLEIYNSNRFSQIFIITHVSYIKDRLEDISTVFRIEKKSKYSQIL